MQSQMPGTALRRERSALLPLFNEPPSSDDEATIFAAEARWHYSAHYLAESRGEEVLEHILRLTNGDKSRAILHEQLKDELAHAKLFKTIVDGTGLDERACGYANGYVDLVMNQETLAEKLFVFQILTEAVSAGYCAWRLTSFFPHRFRSTDSLVMGDETRHLNMGKCLLALCDQDELKNVLPPERRKNLIRQMNSICKTAFKVDMPNALCAKPFADATTSLDKLIAHSVLRENSALGNYVDGLR